MGAGFPQSKQAGPWGEGGRERGGGGGGLGGGGGGFLFFFFFFLRLGRRPKAEAYRCPLEAGKSREMDFP